jgi:sugar lactone lactonase YvrE
MTRAEQLTDPVTEHGEGPVWWPDGHLRCVDMLAGDLVDVDERGGLTRTHVAKIAAVVRPRAGGGAVVAAERGLVLLDATGAGTALPDVWDDPGVRMNEGGCDPLGRFYCGSMAYDAAPGRGRFYRFAADGAAEIVLDGVTISNGFAFAPDGGTAYYVDTPTQRVDAFDFDAENGLTGRRPFVTIAVADGSPDGITVDAAGGVWVACWGGGAVRRFDSHGRLDEVVEVPGVEQVSACTLGGPGLDQLFVTTSRLGMQPASAGAAGAIFVVRDVAAGLPVQPAAL